MKRTWLAFVERRRLGDLAEYVARSETIDGWARHDEARELAVVARSLAGAPVIVEIGSFLGSSAVLLAGARRLAGSGIVHCVDPFDGSGDSHSVPVYEEIAAGLDTSLRATFDRNIREAGLSDLVVAHAATAEEAAATWSGAIDMLFLDGDQSPDGARSAFEAWEPFLKPGGVLAVHNSADRTYSPGHDGQRRVVVESVYPPRFTDVRCVGTTTFARKA